MSRVFRDGYGDSPMNLMAMQVSPAIFRRCFGSPASAPAGRDGFGGSSMGRVYPRLFEGWTRVLCLV